MLFIVFINNKFTLINWEHSLFGYILPESFIFDVNELIFFPTCLIDEIVAFDPISWSSSWHWTHYFKEHCAQ